eukprot:15477142-Alexandrium_andersonii.AAC.1
MRDTEASQSNLLGAIASTWTAPSLQHSLVCPRALNLLDQSRLGCARTPRPRRPPAPPDVLALALAADLAPCNT